ncbi:hypothetical protein D9M69_686570 [compost metagenome]
MQIGPFPFLLRVHAGEVLQVLNDLAYPHDALLGFPHEHRNVFFQEIQFHTFAQGSQAPRHFGFANTGFGLLIGGEQLKQLLDVPLQRAEV